MIWLLSLIMSFSLAHAKGGKKRVRKEPKINLTKIDSCKKVEGNKKVLLIKQWHLAPKDSTKGFKEKYPQEKNQTAIFKILSDKVKSGDLSLIIAEGCEGEINDAFEPVFNGWNMSSLREYRERKEFPKIITNVAMKVEAKYGEKVLTKCGDNLDLIKEGNLRLSNLRGWSGYLSKLTQLQGEAAAPYADSAAQTLKVKVGTPIPELTAKIRAEAKSDLQRLLASFNERNESFVKALEGQEFKEAAIVVGGLHADDLKSKLETAGLNCDVYEPPGYARESENLIRDFQSLTMK